MRDADQKRITTGGTKLFGVHQATTFLGIVYFWRTRNRSMGSKSAWELDVQLFAVPAVIKVSNSRKENAGPGVLP